MKFKYAHKFKEYYKIQFLAFFVRLFLEGDDKKAFEKLMQNWKEDFTE